MTIMSKHLSESMNCTFIFNFLCVTYLNNVQLYASADMLQRHELQNIAFLNTDLRLKYPYHALQMYIILLMHCMKSPDNMFSLPRLFKDIIYSTCTDSSLSRL